MLNSHRVVFGEMEEVLFGVPAAPAVAEQAARFEAERVFLMVSGTVVKLTKSTRCVGRSATAVPASSTKCRRTHRGAQ
jgi:hypothetical protein